jgi:hypothetical protein
MGKKGAARPKALLHPSKLPGTFESRVFIGGSYKAAAAKTGLAPRVLLEQLKTMVLGVGLCPILADEYQVGNPDRDIHHDAIWLLSSCRTAIFELTEFSGALMEIERSADFGTRCIVLHHDPRKLGLRLSWMLTSFAQEHGDRISLYGYLTPDEAVNAARNWLNEMLRKRHAVK